MNNLKRVIFICLIGFYGVVGQALSQDSVHDRESIVVHWEDSLGQILKQEEVWAVPPRTDNTIRFFLNGKQGLANRDRKVIAEPIYDFIYADDPVGRAIFQMDTLQGFIDYNTGKQLTSQLYYSVSPFSEGLAAASIDGTKWGYIDTTGQMVIDPKWTYAESFQDGIAKVINNSDIWQVRNIASPSDIFPTPGKCGYIDKRGEYVIPMEFSYIGTHYVGDRFMRFTRGEYHCDEPDGYCQNPYEGSKWGIMDVTGKIVVADDRYDYILPVGVLEKQHFIVEQDGLVGLLDPDSLEFVFPMGSFSSWDELDEKLRNLKLKE